MGILEFSSTVDIHISDCREFAATMIEQSMMFDAIITDPPYEINYMAKEWDDTGVGFAPDTWEMLVRILKPGGFIAAFAMPRLYHRMACAIEQAGVETYPFMIWQYNSGMPKCQNVSKLFDRDNCPDRTPIGSRRAAGYNSLQIKHGQQQYSKLGFALYEENVSEEAKQWAGYFYGVNTLRPMFDSIYVGRKPIAEPRVIDNLRKHGTGALNVAALRDRGDGSYPGNVLPHSKLPASSPGTGFPTVKPVPLMEDLVALLCPPQGIVLDPFSGTGTTGLACRNLGINCTLVDRDPAMRKVMEQRLGD